ESAPGAPSREHAATPAAETGRRRDRRPPRRRAAGRARTPRSCPPATWSPSRRDRSPSSAAVRAPPGVLRRCHPRHRTRAHLGVRPPCLPSYFPVVPATLLHPRSPPGKDGACWIDAPGRRHLLADGLQPYEEKMWLRGRDVQATPAAAG